MKLVQLLEPSNSIPYEFPSKAFEILAKHDYLRLPRYREGNEEISLTKETHIILNDLIEIGYSDLAVGRIYEGHINALLIIERYGSKEQKEKYFADAVQGKIFGIWNSEHPSEAMSISKANYQLSGAKTFCSGSLKIDRPIITAHNGDGKQMIILEMENYPEMKEDKSFWKVMGMESTVSHRISFSGLTVSKAHLIGEIDDYDREPMISTGAIRFAAVQFGGGLSIADIAIKHLNNTNRSNHPIQNNRIATLGILAKAGKLWFEGYQDIDVSDEAEHINYVNMVRTDVSRICEEILAISEKAIGVQGFLKNHPYEQKYRNLKVYLKQPNPDLALEKIGKYISEHGIEW